MKAIITLFILFFWSISFAQNDSLLVKKEKELVILLNDLRAAKDNTEKEAKNKLFKQQLQEAIKLPEAMTYPFAELKTIGTVISDDHKIRMFNWNVEQDDQSQKYYCYILRYDARKKDFFISELTDNSFMIPARPMDVLEAKDWYGALYYRIIPISRGNKEMYTLLGYDANNTMSNIKLIDVLSFTGNTPKLGSPIFKMKNETLKRIFFEHSEKAYMSLKYEPEYNRIIYDHLSPETESMTGFYSYYVPDFSYDALVYVKDKWVLQEDVVGINHDSSEKLKVYVQNEKTGKLELKEIKEKWENPSDPNAAAGGNEHVAVKPEVSGEAPKKTGKTNLSIRKGRKPKPVTYSLYPEKKDKKVKKKNK